MSELHVDEPADEADRTLVRQHRLALVLVDIGGYTEFMVSTRMSVLHAQEIVFQLLESIIERSDHPLELNKLEGDAVFLFARMEGLGAEVVESVLKQVEGFFRAFRRKASALTQDRASCSCTACSNIGSLQLKAILHVGSAAIRQIRGFVELAGEDVIIVHRLLKNSVALPEYILITESFREESNRPPSDLGEQIVERDPVLGEIFVRVLPAPSR